VRARRDVVVEKRRVVGRAEERVKSPRRERREAIVKVVVRFDGFSRLWVGSSCGAALGELEEKNSVKSKDNRVYANQLVLYGRLQLLSLDIIVVVVVGSSGLKTLLEVGVVVVAL
jgi:hypothetical protein